MIGLFWSLNRWHRNIERLYCAISVPKEIDVKKKQCLVIVNCSSFCVCFGCLLFTKCATNCRCKTCFNRFVCSHNPVISSNKNLTDTHTSKDAYSKSISRDQTTCGDPCKSIADTLPQSGAALIERFIHSEGSIRHTI